MEKCITCTNFLTNGEVGICIFLLNSEMNELISDGDDSCKNWEGKGQTVYDVGLYAGEYLTVNELFMYLKDAIAKALEMSKEFDNVDIGNLGGDNVIISINVGSGDSIQVVERVLW